MKKRNLFKEDIKNCGLYSAIRWAIQRAVYGTCSGDTFSMDYTLAVVMANYLYEFIYSAEFITEEDDLKKMRECADSLMAYADTENWDQVGTDEEKKNYADKRKAFEDAMKYLIKEWNGLWW